MNIVDIINKKKYGKELNEDEIAFFVKGASSGIIADYQISALLMAILIKGMTPKETYYLTKKMSESGELLDLSEIDGITADKHSSGGVGDSTTFIVVSILASLGLKIAKMSGRALGHTGGTIDKLESIPGFKTELSSSEFIKNVNSIGVAVTSQSKNICPADKKLYAIRDVTGTVDSIPLIASSIMSKKLAGGAKNIVLDVKCGSGAFMEKEEDAEALAKAMVNIGKSDGRNIAAVITDMNEPLDDYIGNRLEIMGAVNVLKGEKNRLYKVAASLTVTLLEISLKVSPDEAEIKVNEALSSGKAYKKFLEFIAAQGGDINYIEKINDIVTPVYEVKSSKCGYVSSVDAKKLGNVLISLGGGRRKLEDVIDYNVGLKINKRIGDYVKEGDSLATVFCNRINEDIIKEVTSSYTLHHKKPVLKPLVLKIIK